jgi:hypothetical protein
MQNACSVSNEHMESKIQRWMIDTAMGSKHE